jgi:hypothetical protein
VKKFARKVRKSIKPLYLIPVVVVIVLLIVVGVFVVGGGDDEQHAADAALGIGEGDVSKIPGRKIPRVKQAPRVRTGELDEARRQGRLAVAQARGTIVDPAHIRIRVSARPKQVVTVNWQLGCYRNKRSVVGKDSYKVRSPDVRGIRLPMQGAETCIATASAQLTRNEGSGVIKVQIISG